MITFALAVYALSISPCLPVEDCVFVLGQHFWFRGHFFFPELDCFCCGSLPLQGIIDGGNDCIDSTQTETLTVLLEFGEAPWYFPGRELAENTQLGRRDWNTITGLRIRGW